MAHFVDELRELADTAILAMREAALAARYIHARAELMRHMLTTARKVKGESRSQAIETVIVEWMNAWHLPRARWPELARQMEAFTAAFFDYADDPTAAADVVLRASCAVLDAALAKEGTSLSDQMAWRSQCAHGWWELVRPTPQDLPGGKDRPMMPVRRNGAPFWEIGCAEMCK